MAKSLAEYVECKMSESQNGFRKKKRLYTEATGEENRIQPENTHVL